MDRELATALSGPSDEGAQRLLGCLLVRELDGHKLVGKIVETEAYDQTDVASHSYRGDTPRTHVMFGPPAHLYVYFSYGMHFCCNVVTGPDGHGAAVLLRAVEPLEGMKIMRTRRKQVGEHNLTNGPAKLCQAFGINMSWNGHDLHEPPLQLVLQPPVTPGCIVQTTRVGISRGQDVPWRFYIKDNKFVSRPL